MMMTVKEELKTKDGASRIFRVGFRDGTREVSFPDSGAIRPGRSIAAIGGIRGVFYKLRGRLSGNEFRAAVGDPQDPRSGRRRRGRRIRSELLPAPVAFRPAGDARRTVGDRPAAHRESDVAQAGRIAVDRQPRCAAGASGRAAKPPRLRRRTVGAYVERDANLHLSGPTSTPTTIPR